MGCNVLYSLSSRSMDPPPPSLSSQNLVGIVLQVGLRISLWRMSLYYFCHISMGLQIIPNIIWRKIPIIWQCKFSLSLNSNFESGFMNNWGRSGHVKALLWESVQSLGGGDAPVIMVTSKVSHAWWWPDSPDIFSIKVWGLLWWRRIWWIFIPNGANVSSYPKLYWQVTYWHLHFCVYDLEDKQRHLLTKMVDYVYKK